jgi:hypothetical protein
VFRDQREIREFRAIKALQEMTGHQELLDQREIPGMRVHKAFKEYQDFLGRILQFRDLRGLRENKEFRAYRGFQEYRGLQEILEPRARLDRPQLEYFSWTYKEDTWQMKWTLRNFSPSPCE